MCSSAGTTAGTQPKCGNGGVSDAVTSELGDRQGSHPVKNPASILWQVFRGVARCCLPRFQGQPQHLKYQNRIKKVEHCTRADEVDVRYVTSDVADWRAAAVDTDVVDVLIQMLMWLVATAAAVSRVKTAAMLTMPRIRPNSTSLTDVIVATSCCHCSAVCFFIQLLSSSPSCSAPVVIIYYC